MNKKINVMGIEDFKETGMFFYCTSTDIQPNSQTDILKYFDGAKKMTLENKNEFEIMKISPMMAQFTNKAVFLIKIDTNNIPAGIYPTTATIH